MTRVVAGTAGGRTLTVPRKGTRPTSERVREALFSRLEHLDVVDGARVLDLFAGSGALGLEAASRVRSRNPPAASNKISGSPASSAAARPIRAVEATCGRWLTTATRRS